MASQLARFCRIEGITISKAEHQGISPMTKGDLWKVWISRQPRTEAAITIGPFDYSDSLHNRQSRTTAKPKAPDVADVLYCLLADASYIEYTPDELQKESDLTIAEALTMHAAIRDAATQMQRLLPGRMLDKFTEAEH